MFTTTSTPSIGVRIYEFNGTDDTRWINGQGGNDRPQASTMQSSGAVDDSSHTHTGTNGVGHCTWYDILRSVVGDIVYDFQY